MAASLVKPFSVKSILTLNYLIVTLADSEGP